MSDFWARRKAAVEAEHAAEDAALAQQAAEAKERALAERSDAELLAEANQPEPEALDSPEAVRDFMQSALPQRLKTRALRRLWRLNPVLANLDGLVDYGEDFTDSAMVIENMQTAYQVGKGMLAHVEAMAAKEEEQTEPELAAAQDEVDTPDTAPEDEAMAHTQEAPESVESDPTPLPAYEPEPENAPEAPLRRRMAFSFDTAAAT